MTDDNITLCVPRASSGQNPHQPVLVRSQVPTRLPLNSVLIKIDRFGFSANNITYQTLGEHPHFRYFDFCEVPETGQVSRKTHGVFPVWGFGTIVKSSHSRIHEGERVYGFFAPTRYLLVTVSQADVNKHAFYVPRPHLPPDRRPYNQIIRCAADPQYSSVPSVEDLTMLYRPLFWTSYWCEDWLYSSNYRDGATTILISSASAKTAFCLAYLIQKRIKRGEVRRGTRVVGLTSERNLEFTNGLKHYDELLEYRSFSSGHAFQRRSNNERWIYIDVASNDVLNKRILAYFASPYAPKLAACVVLGLTTHSPSPASFDWNVDGEKFSAGVGEPTSQFWPVFERFFMPEWLDIRKHQLLIGDIFKRQDQAWKELMTDCMGWVDLKHVYGDTAVKEAYEGAIKNGLGPDKGLVWSLWGDKNGLVVSRL